MPLGPKINRWQFSHPNAMLSLFQYRKTTAIFKLQYTILRTTCKLIEQPLHRLYVLLLKTDEYRAIYVHGNLFLTTLEGNKEMIKKKVFLIIESIFI